MKVRIYKMKIKTTAKQLKQYHKIIAIGYCNAENLLHYENAFAYTCGTYGWNSDNFDVNGVLISTGYRPVSSKNTNSNYALVDEYNKRAEKIVYNHSLAYEDKKTQIKALLAEFVAKATE